MLSLLKQLVRWMSKDRANSKIATMFLLEANMHQNIQ